jgi:hypothetical protein
MNKLGKNKFLVAMGVLIGIAIIAYAVLVLPAGGTASGHTTKINSALNKVNQELADLPGDPNVKTWADQADALKKRYADELRKQLDKDVALGQWFDGIDDNSTFATFMAPYDDMRIKLENELVEKGVELGSPVEKDGKPTETGLPGFNWIKLGDVQRADTHDKEMQAKEILQKRFNICRAIVNAVTADVDKTKLPKRRLLDVSFLEKFPFLPVSGINPGGDAKLFSIPIDYKRYVGYAGPGLGSFTEQMLPANGDEAPVDPEAPKDTSGKKDKVHLGRTLTFGFAVVMDYHQIPGLIRSLIDPPGGPELNLTIVGVSEFVYEPNPPERVETVNIPAGGDKDPHLEKAKQQTANCPPPQVHVYITCQVFDIDPAAVPPFLKP